MKKFTLLLMLLMVAACSPKKDSVRSARTVGSNIGTLGVANQCPNGASNIGAIYDQTGNLENQVRALLSATMLPQDIGSVSSLPTDSTGVRFAGKMKLDANGNVIGAQSKILIEVYDSIWLQNRLSNPNEKAIQIEFDPASGATITGQFNMQTGQGYINLHDQYGDIRFTGAIDAQYFSGTVSFQNTSSVVGAASQGNLGQFYILRCGIVY